MEKRIEITVRGGAENYSYTELKEVYEAQRRELARWREAADVLSCATPEELEKRLDAVLKCVGGLTVANQQYMDKLQRIDVKAQALIKYVGEVM